MEDDELFIVGQKLEELKNLLIGKELQEQKEIIVGFFYTNRTLSEHFEILFQATKDIFAKDSSLSPQYLQEFIDKTFITNEIMCYTPDWDISEDDFDEYIPKNKWFTYLKLRRKRKGGDHE